MSLHVVLLLGTLVLSGIFVVVFVWAAKHGQFDDVEEAKYEMFREDPPEAEGDDGERGA